MDWLRIIILTSISFDLLAVSLKNQKWSKTLSRRFLLNGAFVFGSIILIGLEDGFFPETHLFTFISSFLLLSFYTLRFYDYFSEEGRILNAQNSIISVIRQNKHKEVLDLFLNSHLSWDETIEAIERGLSQNYKTLDPKTLCYILNYLGSQNPCFLGFIFNDRLDILKYLKESRNWQITELSLREYPLPKNIIKRGQFPFFLEEIFDWLLSEQIVDPILLKKYYGYSREVKKLL